MTLSYMQKMILTAIGVGIVIGLVVGGIGALLGLPAGVRGGLTGGVTVITLAWLNRRMRLSQASKVEDKI